MKSDWLTGATLGKSVQYYNPDYPDWHIYEQAAGFSVWQEFRFDSKHASFEEAEAAVKASQ